MTTKTGSREHQRSRAAFEERFDAMDFTRTSSGERYADVNTFIMWRAWKACWCYIKENGTNP